MKLTVFWIIFVTLMMLPAIFISAAIYGAYIQDWLMTAAGVIGFFTIRYWSRL